ncbi:MAG: peptidoglycan-binding protein, partial [Candidatus Azambacteria bacterium]|nr:peptidoglycan-binding protein [Candidatus Azambacteria bacterium]
MHKIIGIFSAIFFVLAVSNSLFVSAQTTSTSSSSVLIQTLRQQIETLKAQIEALVQAQSQVQTAAQNVSETLKLVRGLKEGMSGEDVRLLQETLAANPEIYPEGIISGYYGRLTAQAVKRFQKKFNLEQVGQIGPKTLKELNKELEKNQITTEKTNENKEQHCAIVPPGHLIAPGWLKKQDGVKPVVPVCQTLPSGIAKKLGLATSTPPTIDTIAPVISQISATSTTANSIHIAWLTNETATGKIWYNTSSPVVATTTTPMLSSTVLTLNHDILLPGLTASTTYHYIVSSSDGAG